MSVSVCAVIVVITFALEIMKIILFDVNALSMVITLATLNVLNIGVGDGRKIKSGIEV